MASKVRAADLKPGMVPDKAVMNHYGRKLMAGGEPLTEQQIRIIRSWGVAAVEIRGGNVVKEGGEPPLPEEAAPAGEALEALFSFNDRAHPMIKELYEYRLRGIAGESPAGARDEG